MKYLRLDRGTLKGIAVNFGASFFIAAGWQWYHFSHHPRARFIIFSTAVCLAVFVLIRLFRRFYMYLVSRFERHLFWQTEFFIFLDELILLASLYFLVFFSRNEVTSLLYFAAVSVLIYWRLDRYLGRHPMPGWRKAGRAFFLLSACIFAINAGLQYYAFSHYILDSNIKYYNIVLFRSIAMSAFWLCGFSLASLFFVFLKRHTRYAFFILWIIFYAFSLLVGMANVGVLYHTGLYFNPVITQHAGNGGELVYFSTTVALVALYLIISSVFLFVVARFIRTNRDTERRYWFYYDLAVIALSVVAFFTVASLRNTPEAMIIKSFYNDWRGADRKVELHPIVLQKLERFGLKYNLDSFYVSRRDKVYSSESKLLSDKFGSAKPNIVIIFLESFSSRLTDIKDISAGSLTPGLASMARDKNTTVFKNIFNPSTPTVTGLIGQLCSFLPPTGHNEIEIEKHIQNLYLYCLPRALSENGYKSNLYITAVDEDFASKDTILESMGVKDFWGTKALSKLIEGEPLAWGYSDHQMFPQLLKEMENRRNENREPFLLMLSTVDTHPPFDMVKDILPYGDGKNLVASAIHTTDDAFRIFWEEFSASEFYGDTIIVAIADHAIFPTAYDKKFYPDIAGKMTFYDQLAFQMYVPESILPKQVDEYGSAMDLAPTILHMLGVNVPNAFDGHSLFDDRENYPNLLGMHEFGLWISENTSRGRDIKYSPPNDLECGEKDFSVSSSSPLTLCEFFNYYQWKRRMFEEGRLWFPDK